MCPLLERFMHEQRPCLLLIAGRHYTRTSIFGQLVFMYPRGMRFLVQVGGQIWLGSFTLNVGYSGLVEIF